MSQVIEQISMNCNTCSRTLNKSHIFKFTMGVKDSKFNYELQVDNIFMERNPVIHLVELATRFCPALLLCWQAIA